MFGSDNVETVELLKKEKENGRAYKRRRIIMLPSLSLVTMSKSISSSKMQRRWEAGELRLLANFSREPIDSY